jgi:hypothetical protein
MDRTVDLLQPLKHAGVPQLFPNAEVPKSSRKKTGLSSLSDSALRCASFYLNNMFIIP